MNKLTYFLLTLFGGWFGLHKFATKKTMVGIIYLFTVGLFGYGWLFDIVVATVKLFKNSPSEEFPLNDIMPRYNNPYSDYFSTNINTESSNISDLQENQTPSKEELEIFMWQCSKIAEARDLKEIRYEQSMHDSFPEQQDSKTTYSPQNKCSFYYDEIDALSGHEFESFCSVLLKRNNFVNVIITQGSGDHGIDILAEKDDISYAIQCKCYSSNIGNAAVQQALAGKKFYKKDIAVVLTNQYFTPQAKEEAAAFGVKLWDRDKLIALIQKSNS